MAVDSILRSYGDASRKEDVLSLVEILTPQENWFLKNLGKTNAIDTIHQTMTDSLRTAASAAVSEAGDYTMLARTTPSKLTNVVEIVAIPYRVSRTQQQIQKHTGQNELARQTNKALMDWANAAEFDLVRSTLVSGVSGTNPKMSGILQAISLAKNTSAQISGIAFSSTILKAMMKNSWDNSNGDVATDLFTGSFIRDVIDGFTQKTNAVVSGVNAENIVNAVSVFTTSFGVLRVHTHRYIQQSADATGRVLLVNPDKLKIAYLEQPFIDMDLARSGDYDTRAVVGKLTLEVRNQEPHIYHTGFDKD